MKGRILNMKKHELELILELVYDRQAVLLQQKMWESEEYKELEHIKVDLKGKIKSKSKKKK